MCKMNILLMLILFWKLMCFRGYVWDSIVKFRQSGKNRAGIACRTVINYEKSTVAFVRNTSDYCNGYGYVQTNKRIKGVGKKKKKKLQVEIF